MPAGLLPQHGPRPVLQEIRRSPEEVTPALFQGGLEDLRVGPGEVRRREDIEQLSGGEVDDLLIVAGHAVHPSRGAVQPLLHEQERLVVQVEGPLLPLRAAEAVVLRRRLDGGWRARHEAGAGGIEGEPHAIA